MDAPSVPSAAAAPTLLTVDVLPAQAAPVRRMSLRWGRHSTDPYARATVDVEVAIRMPTTVADPPVIQPDHDELVRQLDLFELALATSEEEPVIVWTAIGGRSYHRRRRCAGLIAAPTTRAEASIDAVERITRVQALETGRTRCTYCFSS